VAGARHDKKAKGELAVETSASGNDGPLKARLSEAWLEQLRAKIQPVQAEQAAATLKRGKHVWDEALRVLRETGDPRELGALLWLATPDGNGMTPLPTRIVYTLGKLFAPGRPHERPRLITESDTPRTRKAAQAHERIVHYMLDQIEAGMTIEEAAEAAAGKFKVSEKTAMNAWSNAQKVPFIRAVTREGRKNRKSRKDR